MANEKLTPEQLKAIEQLKQFSGQLTTPFTMQDRLRIAMQQREATYEKYNRFKLANIPEDYSIPAKGKLILRERGDDDPAPFVTVICDMTPAFKREDIRNARRKLIDEEDSFDHLALNDQEWKDLVNREAERIKDLPIPFYHEALQNFTVRTEDGSVIPFRRSELPRIKYNGYDIVPMVDAFINTERGRTTLFGLGLINIEEDIYQVAVYWFGNVNSRYHDNVVSILSGYFYAQWAFHACPERVIEVFPGEPDPFEEESAPKPAKKADSKRPHRTAIGRRIYVREYPLYSSKGGSREFERRCRCWYVHGYMRTNHKTGKQTWINGYFKGPDRDIPAARRHVKDYVLD